MRFKIKSYRVIDNSIYKRTPMVSLPPIDKRGGGKPQNRNTCILHAGARTRCCSKPSKHSRKTTTCYR